MASIRKPHKDEIITKVPESEVELIPLANRAISKGLRPFRPGQSGNPSGLTRTYYRCRQMLRDASPELIDALINLAITAQDERVRSVCLIACIDRAGVRPMDYDPNSEKAPMPLDLSKLNAEQREQMRELLKAAMKDEPEKK